MLFGYIFLFHARAIGSHYMCMGISCAVLCFGPCMNCACIVIHILSGTVNADNKSTEHRKCARRTVLK